MKRLLRLLFTLVLIFFLVVVALLSPVLAQPAEVWVDDDWAGLNPGDLADGHTFGTDAFGRTPDVTTQARVSEAYGKLPLSFEPNRGQTEPQVKRESRKYEATP